MAWRIATVLILAAALSGCGKPTPATCPVDGARYVLRNDAAYSVRFRKVPGAPSAHHLLLEVRSDEQGRVYSFTINRGNGYGEATLAPAAGSMATRVALYTVNDAGAFVDYFGAAEDGAPKQLLMPSLGQALWYEGDQIAGKNAGQRERMPVAFFDRAACGPASL